jgi:hypothetical protein
MIMKFAKYTDNSGMASSPLKIKKDGHTMMPLDIKRELNRKSFLEENKLNLEVKIAELEKERDAVIQEAKIQACELDTQKGIIQSVRDLFDVRVYDFNLIAAIKVKLEANNLEQRDIGIRDTAMEMNNIYVTDNNLKAVPPAQFAWWNRCFGHMIDRAEELSDQAKALKGHAL